MLGNAFSYHVNKPLVFCLADKLVSLQALFLMG